MGEETQIEELKLMHVTSTSGSEEWSHSPLCFPLT